MSLPSSEAVPGTAPGRSDTTGIVAGLKRRSRELLHRYSWRYGWAIQPLVLAVFIRILVFTAGIAGTRLIGIVHSGTFPGMLKIWLRKDATWYIAIGGHGYYYYRGLPLTANFFPLFPTSMSIAHHTIALFFGSGSTNSYLVAGMAVSWVAFVVACVLLFRLVADRFGEPTAYLSVLLLGIFPFSFYYGLAYSESLYLLCAVVAFFGIERGNWWVAGAGALFAGAARPIGLVVGLAVVVAYALDWVRTRHPLRWDIFALALTPLGVVAFAIYCWLHFGNPLAYLVASSQGWQEHLQTAGLIYWLTILIHPHLWLYGSLLNFIYALLILTFLVACYPIYRLLGASYAVFAFFSCLTPVLEFSEIKSNGRYMSVIFAAFIILAYALQKRPILRDMVIVGFVLLLAVCVTGFAGGYGFS